MPDDDMIEPEVLERGDIFFLYRPRVEEEHPSSLADVQRFFIVLRPEGGKKLRLLAVGRKRLPDVGGLPAFAAPSEPWMYDGRIVLDAYPAKR